MQVFIPKTSLLSWITRYIVSLLNPRKNIFLKYSAGKFIVSYDLNNQHVLNCVFIRIKYLITRFLLHPPSFSRPFCTNCKKFGFIFLINFIALI